MLSLRNRFVDNTVKTILVSLVSVPIALLCALIGPSGFALPDPGNQMGMNIFMLRCARVAAGFAVGAALASSGAVFQAVLRNPLADPYVLGVSGGAALGASAAIVSGIAGLSPFAIPLCAFGTALLSLLAVVTLAASGRRAASESGIILCGVIVSAMASALLMILQTYASGSGLQSMTWWMLGSLQSVKPALLCGCAACSLAGFAASFWLARDLDALTLGGEMAHHLGIDARRVSLAALGAATLSAASAVALAGLIGFVGLIVPHAARLVCGAGHRRLLPASLFAGGALLVLCDTLARVACPPRELPVGVVTALLGGPFFIWLLRRGAH